MRTWRLLLIGFGTVGQGVAARLRAGAADLAERGCDARLVGVIDPMRGSAADARGLDPAALRACVDDGRSLAELGSGPAPPVDSLAAIRELEADIVVEVTPTDLRSGGVGLEHVRAALEGGRHVITTNKGPIALAGPELDALARVHDVELRCEGTVMSGTPLLSLAEAGLAGAGVRAFRGVLNGTCNFMLGRFEEGASWDEALAQAQARGYAEAEPAGDVDGWDAAAKVAILGQRVLGLDLSIEAVERVGIRELEPRQVAAHVRTGERWRLVGSVEPDANGVAAAAVRPLRMPASDPLAGVGGVDNMVTFVTDALGAVSVRGPGAGLEATGHAVIADLLAIHDRHRRQ